LDLGEFFQRGADTQGAVYLRLRHLGTNLIELISVLGEVEMAVRIDKHGQANAVD